MRLPVFQLSLAAAVLLACPGPKESETTATTGDSGDETIGHSSNSQSGAATTGGISTSNTTGSSNTTVPPDPTDGPDETTSTTATTVSTSTTAPPDDTTTTGGEACVPDPPAPKMCNKAKNAHVADDDHDAIGASTGDCTFICPSDIPGGQECDIFEQNCPEGQKCNAWSSDGDNSWDATKCVPVDANPDPIGAPCTVEGSGVTGIDSCVKGAMCWGVDDQTGMGTCVEQCTCSIDNPICAVTPNSSCTIANDGVIVLCLPSCDPLSPGSCKDGEVCIGNPGDPNTFICVVDASGGEGALGDPCQFVNACDPTLLCADPGLMPELCDQQSAGCCVPFCDLGAVDCPQGADCLPWFEQGQAPKCFEHIGVCGQAP